MNTETRAVRSAANQLNGQKEKLVADVKTVVGDAEDLIKQAKNTGAEGYAAVRAELADKLAETIIRLHKIQEELMIRASYTTRTTDAYVHENPWKSMGVVAAAAIVLGLILRRG